MFLIKSSLYIASEGDIFITEDYGSLEISTKLKWNFLLTSMNFSTTL